MNNIQKIGGLLAKEGRTIVYGIPQSAETDNVIALWLGDGEESIRSLHDKRRAEYTVIETAVYASDYLSGYDLLLELKNEIGNAVKSTVAIMFMRILASEYDEKMQKHVLKAQYKIIE